MYCENQNLTSLLLPCMLYLNEESCKGVTLTETNVLMQFQFRILTNFLKILFLWVFMNYNDDNNSMLNNGKNM